MAYSEDDDVKTPPKPATRPDGGVMDRGELESTLGPILTDCVSFVDSVLSPERAEATRYYNGEPFGNEEEGRSQIVLTELRDTVSGTAPDVLRIFFGPERVVEFLPKQSTREAAKDARVQTDYVHFCFTERNQGFLESLAVLKDGLIRKLGIFKVWWDDSSDVRAYTLKNVTDDELTALAAKDDIELLSVKVTGTQDADDLPPAPPMQQQPGQPAAAPGQPVPQPPAAPAAPAPQKLHTVHMTKALPGRLRVKAVPPEEFLYNRTARDTDTEFVVLAHRMKKTRSQLVALGIPEKVIEEFGGAATDLDGNEEVLARQLGVEGEQQDEAKTGDNDEYEYIESYVRMDVDGDGIAELRQVCTIGPSFHVTNGDGLGEPVDGHPFALFIPDPEPHTLHGNSFADRTMDLQEMKSSVFRAQADALSASIFPRISYVEGQANVLDILNTAISAPIRMRSIGAVQPITMPYNGAMATEMLQTIDAILEQRTGRRKGVEGLDADALQSTTAQGVDAAVNGARAQTEMLARIFAEMTLKPLFRRMYKLLRQNQPEESVKLRDQVYTLNPSAWEDELDVAVNVALGTTLVERKLAVLDRALGKQEQVLQLLGPQNPIVSLSQYADTLQRGVELGGFRDVESFFSSVRPDWQPPQQAPQPSPEETLAKAQLQIEQMRVQKDLQIKEAELQLKQRQTQQEHDRNLARDAAELALKKLEIEYKYGAQQLQGEFEQNMARNEQLLDAHRTDVEHSLARADQAHSQELERQQQEHDQMIAEQEAAAKAQAAQAAPTE